MKISIYLMLCLFICTTACLSPMEKRVKKRLEDKYGEEFTIFHDHYTYMTKGYQFAAAPKRNKQLRFWGAHSKDFSRYVDQYLMKYYSFLYTQEIRKEMAKGQYPYYIKGSVTFNDEVYEYDQVKVDTLKIAPVLDTASYISIGITCGMFKDLNEETKQEQLGRMLSLVEPFKKREEAAVTITLYVWKPQLVLDKGFELVKEAERTGERFPMDHIADRDTYLSKRLKFHFDTEEPYVDFNIDTLYNHIVDTTADTFEILNMNYLYEQRTKNKE